MTKEEMIKNLIVEHTKLPLLFQVIMLKESADSFYHSYNALSGLENETKESIVNNHAELVDENLTSAFTNYITANSIFSHLISRLSDDEMDILYKATMQNIKEILKKEGYASTAVN